jgi:hypothetical protein
VTGSRRIRTAFPVGPRSRGAPNSVIGLTVAEAAGQRKGA